MIYVDYIHESQPVASHAIYGYLAALRVISSRIFKYRWRLLLAKRFLLYAKIAISRDVTAIFGEFVLYIFDIPLPSHVISDKVLLE